MILLDNTVLSNFALAGELPLLKEFCRGSGATTLKVVDEFDTGVVRGLFKAPDFSWLRIFDFENEIEKSMFARLNQRLGVGEASCLTLAILRKYDFLSDDMMVRKIAYREGVRISGSVGVLIALVKMEKITLANGNKVLSNFIRHGYFSPTDKLDEFL
jgi:predicted nucleic acid-binding protein